LEREHGKIFFTLKDIEKRFFSMDEQIAREKILTRIALGNAANSLKRGKQPSHKSSNQNSRGKSNNKTTHASAHAASYEKNSSKPIICYNCGEEGHIAPKCPHAKQQKRSIAKRPNSYQRD
jgi:6-phosphogluconolactonase/glucosamine-6-phosphate isomerase/deaminase